MGKGPPTEHDCLASLLFPLPASHHVSSRFLTPAGPLLVFAKVLLEGPLSPYNTIAALPKDTQLKNAFLMIALVDAHCRKCGRDWDLWRGEDPNSTPRGGSSCLMLPLHGLCSHLSLQVWPSTPRDPPYAASCTSASSQTGEGREEAGPHWGDVSLFASEPGLHEPDPVSKVRSYMGLVVDSELTPACEASLWSI